MSLFWPSSSSSAGVVTCSTWMRRRAARASAGCAASPASRSRRRARPDATTDRRRRARPRARSSAPRPRHGSRRADAPDAQAPRARFASSATSRSPVEAPMKILTPAVPGSRSSSARLAGIVVGRADIEGVVAPHAVLRARQLVGDRLRAVGIGLGVGHLEHRGHAAEHRGAAAAFEIFLVHRGPARGNGPGCRSRRAARRARCSRSSRPHRRVAPIATILPPRTPTSASHRAAGQYARVPPVSLRSIRAPSLSLFRRVAPASLPVRHARDTTPHARHCSPIAPCSASPARMCAASCRAWSPGRADAGGRTRRAGPALLTPQGKALFDFILWADGEAIADRLRGRAGRCAGPAAGALSPAPRDHDRAGETGGVHWSPSGEPASPIRASPRSAAAGLARRGDAGDAAGAHTGSARRHRRRGRTRLGQDALARMQCRAS